MGAVTVLAVSRGLVPAEPPYVLCNQRVGLANPEFGAHKNRWLSGSVAWIFRLITEDMLGAKAEIAGLRIDPCLPSAWTHARIERTFRGAVYEIDIRKPKGTQRGKVTLKVDGQPGAMLPRRCRLRKHVFAARRPTTILLEKGPEARHPIASSSVDPSVFSRP